MEKNFDAAAQEPRITALWEEAGAFDAGQGKRREDSFCIMLPPPNVTGVLHAGHAFNQTLMDILVRWHRMRGFDTLFQPGQDHAGIATQMVVERELAKEGKRRTDFSREEFLAKVWEWKQKSGGTIISQMKRLGASCDWSRNAFTMSGAPGAPEGEDGNFHDAVIRVFVDMHEKGLIYRGKRLVNWDPHFETAISDLEVESVEVQGHMWHFKYPLAGGETYLYIERDADDNITLREERDYISIATTRPETMLGDGAVAVHPEDERYAAIIGKLCEIPVGPKAQRRLIPIITDPYPDPEFGSGAVKITGAHDFNDYEVARRAGLPMYRLMHWDGTMRRDGRSYEDSAQIAGQIARGERGFDEALIESLNLVPDHLRGLDRFEARKQVIAEISSEQLTMMTRADDPRLGSAALKQGAEGSDADVPLVEHKLIMQPFGDRSKVVIEPMLTDQWFVDTAQIVQPALDAVRDGQTRIMPEQHAKVYFHWLENIEPWCISRQLWWGHQIPVWYDDEGNHYCATSEDEARIKAGGHTLRRDPDVLDTWFSSGLWPIGTLGWPDNTPEMQRYFPTTVLVTGFDILFFWVARMMMMQYAVVGEKPFKDVYVHALVRDEKGKKMSKSLGNVLDPIDLIDQYGADAVRFTFAAMAAMGRDLKLSTSRIEGYRNFGTKLWNASRFAQMNHAFDTPASETPPEARAAVNRWIISETEAVFTEVDAALSAYRFNDAANTAYAFVWGKVCDWYVEFAKPLLRGETPKETRAVMGWVIDRCIVLLHPFMPFLTENLWGSLRPREALLALTAWPEGAARGVTDAEALREMRWVIAAIEGVRSSRAALSVPAGAVLDVLTTGMSDEAARYWTENAALIQGMARLNALKSTDILPRDALTITLEGTTLGLPVGDVIDPAAETARLGKSRQKLEKELSGLRGRLGNPKFIDSAPEEVVEETRANLRLREEEALRLDEALARLAAMAEG